MIGDSKILSNKPGPHARSGAVSMTSVRGANEYGTKCAAFVGDRLDADIVLLTFSTPKARHV